MNRTAYWVYVVALSMACVQHLFAQERVEYSETAEGQFGEAVALYDAGAYRDAAGRFDRLVREYPSGHRITAAFVMKGKSFFHAGEILEAAKTMKAFLTRFPGSSYAPDAEFVLGQVYNRIERHEEAFEMYMSVLRRLPPSPPPRLVRGLTVMMDSTVDGHFPLPELRGFLGRARTAAERAYLWLKIAEKEAGLGNSVAAGIAMDSLILGYPEALYRERAAELRARLASGNSVKLGVLLPFMRTSPPSAMKDIGNEVYDGILYAVEQYSRDAVTRVSVTLETRDTDREPSLATKGAEELADDKDVVGIIGPVFSATVTSAAAVANVRGVPLVTPTANANGIAATGKYIFQANPDYDKRGRAMARYAIQKRGFRTLAVLAPIDAYGKFLAESFIQEVQRLGARVLVTEWYERGSSDLKQPLAKIRRAGMLEGSDVQLLFSGRMRHALLMKFVDLGVPIYRLDSLISRGSTISGRALLGPRAHQLLDSMAIPVTYDDSKVDSLEYPVNAIEGLYVPISAPEEVGIVASQVVYFNLQTQLLGSGEWNSFVELNANKRYCEGVIFESDTYIDTTGGNYAGFLSGFTARFKSRPTKNTMFGYDVAGMVLDRIRNGATTREVLQKALAGIGEFQGYHSKIGLAGDRVNGWLSILQYTSDEIRKVADVLADSPPGGGRNEGIRTR